MNKSMRLWVGLALMSGLFTSVSRAADSAVSDSAREDGHIFGRWPAVSAVIHDADQKDLDLGERDFLIEVWFRPLPTLQYKRPSADSVLMSKKCANLLPGYTLGYLGSRITLTLCGRNTELEKDHDFSVDAGLSTNAWCFFAAGCSRRDGAVALYVNGRKIRTYTGVDLGDLSNHEPFNIAYADNQNSSTAHCRIREARVWTFRNGLPADLDTLIANRNRDPAAADAPADAAWSRWVFGSRLEDIADLGNNGNTLCYVPHGYKQSIAILPFPEDPAGTVRHVNPRHPRSSDEGDGSSAAPFRTIARGVRATYPGDVLRIGAGIYRETVYPRAGENGKPVTIEGEKGAVILGSVPLPGWTPLADGVWVITNWNGKYEKPADSKESDARSTPGNLLFVDDEPMNFVKTRGELVPGTWTVEPILERGPKTILLCPLPDIDPTIVTVEITESGTGGLTANSFTHVRNLEFRRCGVGLYGRGNLLEGCTIAWTPFCCLGIRGQDQTVRNNRILWGGNSGVGGTSTRLLFENNLLSYNGWRNYGAGWHGGASKLIPANTDHVMRRNEFCYNDIAAIWYDAQNQGNRIDGNICRDNSGHGGIFDEVGFGNFIENNLVYNNYGQGICVGETSEDRLYRNIVFNNYGAGLFFRSGGSGGNVRNRPEVAAALKEEFGQKLDVRRYQGLVSYEREKTLREMVEKYWCDYVVRSAGKLNNVIENVIFNNWGWGGIEVNQLVGYSKGASINTNIINHYAGNVYWNQTNTLIFSNGRHCTRDLDFKTWQELSGQDRDSRFMDPFENRDAMPDWFRERFPFKSDDFRPLVTVMDDYLPNVKKSTARTVLMSRLVRSKTLEKAAFTDPMLFGVHFAMEGQPCVSLWSQDVGIRDFLAPNAGAVVRESPYLKRTTLDASSGRVRVLVGEAPITLIGVGRDLREDRSAVLDLPMWTEPGQAVAGRLILENAYAEPRDYDVTVGVAAGWKIENGRIRKTLKGGEELELALRLTPPEGVRQGMFQADVTGTAGGQDVKGTKNFGIGSLLVLKHLSERIKADGDLSEWGELGIPNGIAEAPEQVVFGAENWKGPADLSARAWVRWNDSRQLYLAIEVTDDLVVRNDDPLKSDSVQFMVDVRAPWKHYMRECTPGTFNITMTPGDDTAPATAAYGRLRVGSIRGIRSRRTEKGYILELDIRFHTRQVEDPGWVAGREVRLGILAHDVDEAAAGERKTSIGVWHTAEDAEENCASLTTFITEK